MNYASELSMQKKSLSYLWATTISGVCKMLTLNYRDRHAHTWLETVQWPGGCFIRWNVSVIFCWDILATETFRSFVSKLY